MDLVTLFLLMIAGLFLLGAVGEIIFAKTQIPDVVWLIIAGIILGPVTGTVPREMLSTISPYFAAITLIVVLFEGGSKIVLNDLIKAAPRASLLATLSFSLTVVAVAAISMVFGALDVLPEWSLLKGIMLGAILGGSSALIIMPSMALAKVEEKVANLVSLESSLTDALCVVVTIAMIDIIVAGSGSVGGATLVLARNFGIALAVGIIAGWVWMPVLRLLAGNVHAYPMTFAALIVLYVVVEKLGGSAAMGILTFAVMVGNAEAIMKRVGFSLGENPLEIDMSVRTVNAQMSFIIKSFFFTFIGMMLSPPWGQLALGLLFGVILLGARLPGVWMATRGADFHPAEIKLVNVSLPRGMAAGVLATLPFHSGVPGTENLPSMVFAAVLTSILIFAVGFPMARRSAATAMPSPPPPASLLTGEAKTPIPEAPVTTTPYGPQGPPDAALPGMAGPPAYAEAPALPGAPDHPLPGYPTPSGAPDQPQPGHPTPSSAPPPPEAAAAAHVPVAAPELANRGYAAPGPAPWPGAPVPPAPHAPAPGEAPPGSSPDSTPVAPAPGSPTPSPGGWPPPGGDGTR
jgi:potassium/hydrogen antiporter